MYKQKHENSLTLKTDTCSHILFHPLFVSDKPTKHTHAYTQRWLRAGLSHQPSAVSLPLISPLSAGPMELEVKVTPIQCSNSTALCKNTFSEKFVNIEGPDRTQHLLLEKFQFSVKHSILIRIHLDVVAKMIHRCFLGAVLNQCYH